jgi:hypothetical protein
MNAVSRIGTARVIACRFSVAQDYAEDFFTAAVRDVAFSIPFQTLVPSLGARLPGAVQLSFREQFEVLRRGGRHNALAIVWGGESTMFADFRGTLELRVALTSTTEATLEGRYRPRYGVVGKLFDHLFGYRIAEAMLETLMNRLADALERREAILRRGESAAIDEPKPAQDPPHLDAMAELRAELTLFRARSLSVPVSSISARRRVASHDGSHLDR